MGKSPLILAALASEAVPGLRFTRVQPLEKNAVGVGDSALLTAESGVHYIIRLAKPGAAGADQDTELAALQTLSQLQLPFEIAKLVGETKAPDGSRALLFSFIYGDHLDLERLNPNSPLTENLGSAIAAIHNIPISVLQDAGFPEYDPATLVQSRVSELDRALDTGRIPPVLLQRWEAAFEDLSLFRFTPTVIHGAIDGESIMALDNSITGFMGWSNLKIADPAEDLAWVAGSANEEAAYNVFLAYQAARPSADEKIRIRAKLYSEFDLARWLLHCMKLKDDALVEEAAQMLEDLASEVEQGLRGMLTTADYSSVAATSATNVPEADEIISEFDDEPIFGTVETQLIEIIEEPTPEVDAGFERFVQPAASEPPSTEQLPVYEATIDDTDDEPYYYAETAEIIVTKKPDDRLF